MKRQRSKALSFVGSTPIAEYIYSEGTRRGKRVQALDGAKNHAVVMPHVDLDNAVSALMGAAYGSCDERCMAISVAACVGEQVADALIAKLTPQIKALKIGAGSNIFLFFGQIVGRTTGVGTTLGQERRGVTGLWRKAVVEQVEHDRPGRWSPNRSSCRYCRSGCQIDEP